MRFFKKMLSGLALGGLLTAAAAEPGFTRLFDGRSLDGWRHGGNWTVADGVIARSGPGGSLVYARAQVPDDFELRFDWKVAKGCNSGVYYRPGQYEYQLLDNAHSPYGENPRQSAASLFFCMAPAKDVTRPFGEWNEARIVCKGSVIQHWLNGEKVVDFDYAAPRWAREVELLRLRGGDLAARGAHLSLQDHGADVWFRRLRWRAIPAGEALVSEHLAPMPIPPEALRKEQERVRRMLEQRGASAGPARWRHEELRRWPAAEAHQGVAVDRDHFYAIASRAIGKYRKDTGARVGGWEEVSEGRIRHLNAGVVLDGRLYCAHSNYPDLPEQSSVEVWDVATMRHLESRPFARPPGSLTWIDRRDGRWFACFAHYAASSDPARSRVLAFDAGWRETGSWTFPAALVAKFGRYSASGGAFGPGGRLWISGHDAAELYVLEPPGQGNALRWSGTVPVSAHGQAFAWDPAEAGLLYAIERRTREVIVGRIRPE